MAVLSNLIVRVQSYDRVQDSLYYRHKKSGLTKWDIPSAVRTYLSVDSEAKVSIHLGHLFYIQMLRVLVHIYFYLSILCKYRYICLHLKMHRFFLINI
jgi:hypothetical protein